MSYIVLKARVDNKIVQFIIIVIFVSATGFRDLDVPDTPEYYNIYNSYNNDYFDDQYLGQEIGFIVFGKIIKSIWDNHVVYFGLIAMLNILLIRAALINLAVNVSLGMIAYISFYGLSVNFIFLRVGISMSLFIYFFSLYQNKRGVSSSPILILATFFHKSIVLPILTLPICKYNGTRTKYFWLVVVSMLFYFSGLSSFIVQKTFDLVRLIPYLSKYVYYIDNIKQTDGVSIRHVFNMAILAVVIYFSADLDRIKPMLNVAVFGVVLTSLLSSFLWVDRITDVYVMFNFIIMTIFALENDSLKRFRLNRAMFVLYLICNLFFVSRVMTLFIFKDII